VPIEIVLGIYIVINTWLYNIIIYYWSCRTGNYYIIIFRCWAKRAVTIYHYIFFTILAICVTIYLSYPCSIVLSLTHTQYTHLYINIHYIAQQYLPGNSDHCCLSYLHHYPVLGMLNRDNSHCVQLSFLFPTKISLL